MNDKSTLTQTLDVWVAWVDGDNYVAAVLGTSRTRDQMRWLIEREAADNKLPEDWARPIRATLHIGDKP